MLRIKQLSDGDVEENTFQKVFTLTDGERSAYVWQVLGDSFWYYQLAESSKVFQATTKVEAQKKAEELMKWLE